MMTMQQYLILSAGVALCSVLGIWLGVLIGDKRGYEKAAKALHWKERKAHDDGLQEGYNAGVAYGQHHPKRNHGKFVSPNKA